MKYLKNFESINEPEVGEYVIVDREFESLPTIKDEIGKIIGYSRLKDWPYRVTFPNEGNKYSVFNINQMKHRSKNSEDLEAILLAKKYNI